MAVKRKPRSSPNTNKRLKKKNGDQIPKAMAMDTPPPYSYLPDLVIHHILRHLPTKLAAQASIVSKQWAEVWPSIPELDLDEGDVYSYNDQRRIDFVRFLNCCLKHRENQKLLDKFRLRMGYWGYPGDSESLDEWLSFAVERSVKELDISLESKCPYPFKYCLPQAIFNAMFLTSLNLEGLRVEDSSVDQPISFPYLKSMSFENVIFEGEALPNLIYGCPFVECLALDYCYLGAAWTSEVKISSSSLKSFKFLECYSKHIEVYAMNLESFTFASGFECESMTLFECTNLEYIDITSHLLKHLKLYALQKDSVESKIYAPNLHSFHFGGYLMANVCVANPSFISEVTIILLDHGRGPIFSWPSEYFSTLRDYLANYACSKKLTLYIHDIEGFMFPVDFRKASPSPLPTLKHLNIHMNSAIDGRESELRECLHWMAPSVKSPLINPSRVTNSS